MSEHLTPNQIDRYGRRRLPAAELLSVAEHLAACAACRGQVERALGGDAAFFALRSEVFGEAAAAHLTPEQTADYVDGRLAGEERQAIQDHVAACEECALAVDDLRAFRREVAPELDREYHPAPARSKAAGWRSRLTALGALPRLKSFTLAFGSALAALLVAVAGWWAWHREQKKAPPPELAAASPSPAVTPTFPPLSSPQVSPSPAPAGAAAPVIARLKDDGGEVVLDQAGHLSGVESLSPAYQRMVKAALTQARLEKSPLLAGLNRPASALMGGHSADNQFSVMEPVGKVILSDRPTFRWSRLDGATSYAVEVYDEQFNLVAASPPLTGDSWSPPQALARGRIYGWQVKAVQDGQEFKAPRPPAPQAKFRALDQGKANELAEARRAYAGSHLTLGLLYAQAGLLDEADQELRVLQKHNPQSALVRRLRANIQAMRK